MATSAQRVLAAGVFREREEDEWARQQVIERWQNAGRSILSSVRMVRNAETLGDKFATGAERYNQVFMCDSAAALYVQWQDALYTLKALSDNRLTILSNECHSSLTCQCASNITAT